MSRQSTELATTPALPLYPGHAYATSEHPRRDCQCSFPLAQDGAERGRGCDEAYVVGWAGKQTLKPPGPSPPFSRPYLPKTSFLLRPMARRNSRFYLSCLARAREARAVIDAHRHRAIAILRQYLLLVSCTIPDAAVPTHPLPGPNMTSLVEVFSDLLPPLPHRPPLYRLGIDPRSECTRCGGSSHQLTIERRALYDGSYRPRPASYEDSGNVPVPSILSGPRPGIPNRCIDHMHRAHAAVVPPPSGP